jgi:hypothetical protein
VAGLLIAQISHVMCIKFYFAFAVIFVSCLSETSVYEFQFQSIIFSVYELQYINFLNVI